jgi:hypothetical protein
MASSQIAYAGSDVVVTLNVIDSTGTHQAATGLNASRLSSHPSAVPTVTNPNSEPGVYVLTWSSLSPATSEGDSIVALIEGSVGGTAFSTYAIPLKVVANERGTDNASTFDNAVDTVITDTASRDASKADVSLLATAASITALNDFDPATDTVANVTTVGSVTSSVTTDTASRDASKADVSALATTSDLAVVDGNVDAIKAKTDQLAFTVANQVDANSLTGGTSPADIYTYFTSGTNEDAFKADVTGLSTFDPASQSVTVGTNNDKTGYALSSAANDAIGAAFLAYTLTKGSPGTIERAFWQSLKATQLADGEVSGTPTASAFDTNLTAVTGAYDHLLLLFTSGSLAGEARPIATYTSTNGRITLQEALTSAPSSADEFIVVPDHTDPISEVYAYFTDGSNEDAFKADVSALATQASVDTIDGIVDAIKVKTDELTFTVPGSVDATATADVDEAAIAAAVVAGIGGADVTISSPVASDGTTVTIVRGDDYNSADGRSIIWTGATADQWPDLSGSTVVLTAINQNDILRKTLTVTQATGTQQFNMQLTNEETEITSGRYKYDVQATLASGNIITMLVGELIVKKSYAELGE